MYIKELSTLIKRNKLDRDTKDQFMKYLNQKQIKDKYFLDTFENIEIQLVSHKLIKVLNDYIIKITYHLINLDDEECQGILSHSVKYSLHQLEKSRANNIDELREIYVIRDKFQKWIDQQPGLELEVIEGVKKYYTNWMNESKDEYEEAMGDISIEELIYKLNVYYCESYFMFLDGYQDTFIVKLDVNIKDKYLNSYYIKFSIDGEALDDWID